MSLLAVRGLCKTFGGVDRRPRCFVRRRRRRDGRADRTERRRQIDRVQHDRRPAPPRRRPVLLDGADITSMSAARAVPARGRTHVPGGADLPVDERRRERPDGAHQPSRREPRPLFARPASAIATEALRLLAQVGHGRRRRPALLDARLRRRQARGTRRRAGRPPDPPPHGRAHRRHGAARTRRSHGPHRDRWRRPRGSGCCSPSTTWTSSSAMRTGCWCSCAAKSSRRDRPRRCAPTRGCGRPISATSMPSRSAP